MREDTLIQGNEIKSACFDISLDENKDSITWPFTNDGKFTMKSFYNQLIINELYFPFKFSWNVKTPPKIKLFLWLTLRNYILPKHNLLKRGWASNNSCIFCGKEESIDRLFIDC